MTIRLLYHDPKSPGGVSPFDEAILSIAREGELKLACPYISLDYLNRVINGTSWRLLTDIQEWLDNQASVARSKIVEFLKEHHASVRNYPRLHAKVVIGSQSLMFGSANFTHSGILSRAEVSAIVDDATQVGELTAWFEACWFDAQEVLPRLDAIADYAKSLPDEPAHARADKPKLFPSLSTKPAILAEFDIPKDVAGAENAGEQVAAGEAAGEPQDNVPSQVEDVDDVVFHFPPAKQKKAKPELGPRECVERLIAIGLLPDAGEHLSEITQLVAIHRKGTTWKNLTADSPGVGALIYQARRFAAGTGNLADFVREARNRRGRIEESDYFIEKRAQKASIPLTTRLTGRIADDQSDSN